MSTPTGHYETFTGEDGQDYVRLVASNGQVLMSSEGYVGHSPRAVGDIKHAAAQAATADVVTFSD